MLAPQLASSIGAMILAALVPLPGVGVWAAERDLREARQVRVTGTRRGLTLWPLFYAGLVVAAAWVMYAVAPPPGYTGIVITTPEMFFVAPTGFLTLLGFFATVTSTSYLLKVWGRNVAVGCAVLLLVVVLGPPILAEVTLHADGTVHKATPYLLALSPLATAPTLVTHEGPAVIAMLAHMLLAAFLQGVARRTRRSLLPQAGLTPTAAPS